MESDKFKIAPIVVGVLWSTNIVSISRAAAVGRELSRKMRKGPGEKKKRARGEQSEAGKERAVLGIGWRGGGRHLWVVSHVPKIYMI